LLKRLSFLHCMFLAPSSKIRWAYVHGLISRSSILFQWSHIYFCVSTMLILLLWLCSIVWSQVLWYLKYCSFCSVPWLFMVFCVSKWTFG
jgi:hypothetical protein